MSLDADEQDALATLRMLRRQIDVSMLSAEDREALVAWLATVDLSDESLEPRTSSFAGLTATAMLYDPSREGLEPHLIPCALALRAFSSGISQGLPGAEHVAEEFLRDCGFDEATARQLLEQMVARAPQTPPETLN